MINHVESASSPSAFMSSDSALDNHETTDPTTLETLEDSPPCSKRRKISPRDDSVASSAFTIRPPSTSPAGNELALTPLLLLPRCHLPLSWLDPFPGSTDEFPGHLFSASIPTLEDDLGGHSGPAVLVVRLVDGGDLYAIERVKKGIYALCGLGDWVSNTDLLLSSKRRLEPPTITNRGPEVSNAFEEATETDWRRAAAIPSYDLDISAVTQTSTDVSMAFGPDDSDDVANEDRPEHARNMEGIQGPSNPSDAVTTAVDIPLPIFPGDQAETEKLTLSDVFERLRTQYLQALYVSKTSVGYFAKGPLSRSRTSLQQLSSKGDPDNLPDVVSIYRDGILPIKKMDLKYRETLPKIIHSLPVVQSGGELTPAKSSKKRKSKNKNKLGRNGLYPEEEPLVRVWWRNRHPTETALPQGSSKEAEIKQRVSDLRQREMQLQILWILETIDMEGSKQEDIASAATAESTEVKKTKSKKRQDLNVLLELLLDRLCIWHTVNFEESLLADSVKGHNKNGSSGTKVESDKLRDFCTEVIIPFYASKLPEQCKVINRKLGGPTAISPVRKKRPQAKRTSQVQPGAAVQRTKPLNPRRTLQRVLTDEKATLRGKTPSLNRCNTAPTAPEIKREPSEPLSLHTGFRGGIQNSKRLDNREVDLNSTAKQHEAKLKRMNKLMEQKKELDTAINRLRKPNRELVAREFVESMEQRSTTSRSRKPKNPVRNPLGLGVQVMATPKGNRKKNASGNFPSQPQSQPPLFRSKFSSPVQKVDVQAVPSSTVRQGFHSRNLTGEPMMSGFASGAQSQPAEISHIDGTPSRQSKTQSPLISMPLPEDGASGNSPTAGRSFRVPQLPPRSASDTIYSTPTTSRRKIIQRGLHDKDLTRIEATPPKPVAVASKIGTRVPGSPPGTDSIVQTTPAKRPTGPQEDAQRVPDSVPDSVPRHRKSLVETPRRQEFDPTGNVTPTNGRCHFQLTSPGPDEPNGDLYRTLGWNDDEEDELLWFDKTAPLR